MKAQQADDAGIFVYDMSGKVVASRPAMIVNGLNTISLDLSGLPRGTYLIKVKTGHEEFIRKFLIN